MSENTNLSATHSENNVTLGSRLSSMVLLDISRLAANATEFKLVERVLADYYRKEQGVSFGYDLSRGVYRARVHGVNVDSWFYTFHELLSWILDGGAVIFWQEHQTDEAARDE